MIEEPKPIAPIKEPAEKDPIKEPLDREPMKLAHVPNFLICPTYCDVLHPRNTAAHAACMARCG